MNGTEGREDSEAGSEKDNVQRRSGRHRERDQNDDRSEDNNKDGNNSSGNENNSRRSADRKMRDSSRSPEQKRHVPGKDELTDVMFRLLIPASKAGYIIGRQGVNIQKIREASGARIRIAPSAPGLEERVITVMSSVENIAKWSPAEEALLQIYMRSIENPVDENSTDDDRKMEDSEQKDRKARMPVFRMLLAGSQTGAIIGKGGYKIQQLRDDSGATIRVLEEVPLGANPGDRVIMITGEPNSVRAGLEMVCAHLKEHPAREAVFGPPRSSTPLYGTSAVPAISAVPLAVPSWPQGHSSGDRDAYRDRESRDSRYYKDSQDSRSYRDGRSESKGEYDRSGGAKRSRDEPERESYRDYRDSYGSRDRDRERERAKDSSRDERGYAWSAVPAVTPVLPYVTGGGNQVKVEVQLANTDMGALIGKKGATISHIRTVSGALIKVHEPKEGANHRLVEISGVPEQVAVAQNLVQAATKGVTVLGGAYGGLR